MELVTYFCVDFLSEQRPRLNSVTVVSTHHTTRPADPGSSFQTDVALARPTRSHPTSQSHIYLLLLKCRDNQYIEVTLYTSSSLVKGSESSSWWENLSAVGAVGGRDEALQLRRLHVLKTAAGDVIWALINMSAQAQMRAMLDQLMGTGRDGKRGLAVFEIGYLQNQQRVWLLLALADKLTSILYGDSAACFTNHAN